MSALIFESLCASAWGQRGRSEAILRCLLRPELHTLSFYLHINSDIDPAQSKNEGSESERERERERKKKRERKRIQIKLPLRPADEFILFTECVRVTQTHSAAFAMRCLCLFPKLAAAGLTKPIHKHRFALWQHLPVYLYPFSWLSICVSSLPIDLHQMDI